jgi:ABC-type phosphate transport system substrate-binding protein
MSARLRPRLICLWLAGLVCAPLVHAQGDVAVVVNEQNKVANLSLADLRKVFAGEKRSWPGGVPVKLIVRASGSHERLALLKLLNMSESEYKQYWTAQVFRGEADAEPAVVPSVGMVVEAVRAFPWAISLLDAKDVKPGIKVVKVADRSPGDQGYPLH